MSSHTGKNATFTAFKALYHSSIPFPISNINSLHIVLLVFHYIYIYVISQEVWSASRGEVQSDESLMGLELPFFPLCVVLALLPLSAVDLLALLKWKAYPDRVMDILGRLRHVSGEEIVKVLHEITASGCVCDRQRVQTCRPLLKASSSCAFWFTLWIFTLYELRFYYDMDRRVPLRISAQSVCGIKAGLILAQILSATCAGSSAPVVAVCSPPQLLLQTQTLAGALCSAPLFWLPAHHCTRFCSHCCSIW